MWLQAWEQTIDGCRFETCDMSASTSTFVHCLRAYCGHSRPRKSSTCQKTPPPASTRYTSGSTVYTEMCAGPALVLGCPPSSSVLICPEIRHSEIVAGILHKWRRGSCVRSQSLAQTLWPAQHMAPGCGSRAQSADHRSAATLLHNSHHREPRLA